MMVTRTLLAPVLLLVLVIPATFAINCKTPMSPRNGEVIVGTTTVRSLVVFRCNYGYRLAGPPFLRCQATGKWHPQEPTCPAVDCGHPGNIVNGFKDGSLYIYPNFVTYNCHQGYKMHGTAKLSCQANGKWSTPVPTCAACRKDTYMDAKHAPGRCLPCPAHSQTVTPASTSMMQCYCKEGYKGPPGGPCREVRCAVLTAPQFGVILGACSNKFQQTCNFVCWPGYMFSRGSSMRTCHESGNWDGMQPMCSPCPVNTYKKTEHSCLPCPRHTHTLRPASMFRRCICDWGYRGPPGGPCRRV